MVSPALIGAGVGGLLGAFAPQDKAANLVNPDFRTSFKGPLGTADRDGFTFSQDPNRQGAVDFANQGLQGALGNVLAGADQGRIDRFQNAFINARRPQLETALQQQGQNLNSNIAGQGLTGSSSSIFAQGQQQRNANEQRSQLFNQGILGGEALADQALRQSLSQFKAANAFSQGDINNRLAAQAGTTSALNQGNASAAMQANTLNGIELERNKQQNEIGGSRWANIIGGITAGGSLGGSFGGGGTEGGGLGSLFSGWSSPSNGGSGSTFGTFGKTTGLNG